MLKLKNEVNLSVLEQYGFEQEDDVYVKNVDNKWYELIYVDLDDDRTISKVIEEIGYWCSIWDEDRLLEDNTIKKMYNTGILEIVKEED